MFLDELSMARNIYDIMAICYLHIKQDNTFSYADIEGNVPFSRTLNEYAENKIKSPMTAFSHLINDLKSWYKSYVFSTQDYYNLIIGIDEIEEYLYQSIFADEDFKSYSSLNTIYTDEVSIYPCLQETYVEKLNSIYKNEYKNDYLRKRKDYSVRSVNYKLENYIIYNHIKHNNYNVHIHELIDSDDFVKYINEKKNISIAVCPLLSINIHDLFEIQYLKNKQFAIKNMLPEIEELIILKCQKFIENLNNEIDFLIFPEMLMTQKIVNKVISFTEKKDIRFVFCGSIWENDKNICYVFYEGEEIFRYYKKIPFELQYSQKEFAEVIEKCSNKEQLEILQFLYNQHDFSQKISFQERLKNEQNIHIIDINKFGRIITYICRDIDDDSYMDISKIAQCDFIFLPACSPSNDLANNAASLSERYHCTTIMCNTCSSLCNNDVSSKISSNQKIGFITTPSKHDTTRSHKKFYYSFEDSCRNCSSYCNGRIFSINMEDLYKGKHSVSLNIKEIKR